VARSDDAKAAPAGGQRVEASTWAAIATLAGTMLLVYTGFTTGEWRGVVVSEVQVLVVGFVTWLVLRER
jgi:hypothetical protein